jgi:8-oxo-dGTP pyrophosphatase MutT (NUDIX family)
MSPSPAITPPDYCCAILEDRDGRLLLQWRGPDARRAPGRITCLGGAREPDEAPDACLRRELQEEIGWVPDPLELRVVLEVEGTLTAWFYRGPLDVSLDQLRLEPGLRVILATRSELADLPLAPWHRAVIEAEAQGETRVRIPSSGSGRKKP